MIFGLFNKKKHDNPVKQAISDLPVREKILLLYESGIQQVRNLDRLGKAQEADNLFSSISNSCLKLEPLDKDDLVILIKIYEENLSRGRYEKANEFLQRIETHPLFASPEYSFLMENLKTGELKEAFDEGIFYCCSCCGEPLHHITTPCDCCSFLPLTPDQVTAAMALSSTSIPAPRLMYLGALIKRKQLTNENKQEIQNAVVRLNQNPLHDHIVAKLLDGISKLNQANYRPLKSTFDCPDCNRTINAAFIPDACPYCGSTDLDIPPLTKYKLTIKLCLDWLQNVIKLPDAPLTTQVLSHLVRLKENAVQNGVVVTPETGIPIQRMLEQLDVLSSYNSKYYILITPYEAVGKFYGDASDLNQSYYQQGVGLFNSLSKYLRQGVPLE